MKETFLPDVRKKCVSEQKMSPNTKLLYGRTKVEK